MKVMIISMLAMKFKAREASVGGRLGGEEISVYVHACVSHMPTKVSVPFANRLADAWRPR